MHSAVAQIAMPLHRLALIVAALLLGIQAAGAQDRERPTGQAAELEDRPISAITFEGLQRVTEQTVRNNIRSAIGDPFSWATVSGDVERLNRLGEFRFVDAIATLQSDGTVALNFKFTEHTLINVVQVVGNKLISDQDLLAVVQQVPRGPRDDFRIQTAKRAIEDLYRRRGHYLTTVTIDEQELEEAGILIFRVIEGPRVKVQAIEFEGNQAFDDEQLLPHIKTRTALFLLRKGELDEEQLADDVAALDQFYRDRGYLDVRVDRRIELSPDSTEAKVVFLVSEGQQFTLRNVQATTIDGRPLKVLAPEQIAALLVLKSGDVYSRDLLRKSIRAVQEAYGRMGYMLSEEVRQYYRAEGWDVYVQPNVLRVGDQPQVDLLLQIDEGEPMRVGSVQIQGNFLTRDRVIRRELLPGLSPGRPFDVTAITESQERLQRTRLFNDVRITVQPESLEEPDYRDILVEVKERNTGAINFGVAVGSDSGVFGEFSVTQTNFDITDFPESFDELATGRAFRGAGQRFNMTLRPGTDFFQYATSLTEPHLFDSEYSLTVGAQFRTRQYQRYDEERFGGSFRFGRRLGDIWDVGLQGRVERVKLDEIDAFAPVDIFEDAGPDVITSLGVSLIRTTIGTLIRPGSGSRLELSYDRFGALGGDFDFNAINAEYTVYFTVNEDFLGRISTLKLTSRIGYIFGSRAPTYERFYLGGRSFRGFEFRTISPKGIRADNGELGDDPIGGEWLLFFGAQYEQPIFEEAMTGVVFIDSGTVTDDPGLDDYRVAIGAGIRLYIPQFGNLPLAFDFAVPLVDQDGDEAQIFSFTAELPF